MWYPTKMSPTFIVGYKGLIQLAQRTGQYKTINQVLFMMVNWSDTTSCQGELDLSGERISGDVIGYFGYIKLISGFEKTLYMTKQGGWTHGGINIARLRAITHRGLKSMTRWLLRLV